MTHHTAISPDHKPQVLQAFDRQATLLVPPASAMVGADAELPPAEGAGAVIEQAGPLLVAFLNGVTVTLVLIAVIVLTRARIALQINLEADTVVAILIAWNGYANKNQPSASRESVNQPRAKARN
jgi:hypothetical protein